jgi:hypothetical protein
MNKFQRKYFKKLQSGLDDAAIVVGAQMVTWAAYLCPVDTKNLVNSLNYSTKKYSSEVKQPTTGESLSKAGRNRIKVGTNVVYAPRVEFGFNGQDSLGRTYNQPGTPFLRGALLSHKQQIGKLFAKAMKGAMR